MQHASVEQFHLPIEAGERPVEARLRRGLSDCHLAVDDRDARDELLRMNGELGVDAPLDVALEQIAQAEFGGGERRHHSNHRGNEQAKSDRARPHGALPGTE